MLVPWKKSYDKSRQHIKKQRHIHAPVDTLSLTKEAKIYNGEKKISLTSGAGKTGQLPIKK